ncbi:hypothetical protein [Moorena sp. SIO3A2]|uniref:hypothetical protein n=1 Tax=Moorena sp. SIO3A2 TaxID=2607841 RepID=UPI0013BDD52C|nr:hypothetical protein [Moorena sp. SIO3A2]NER90396.1 hypothetical protein [Moorena sp. SIO3A2]
MKYIKEHVETETLFNPNTLVVMTGSSGHKLQVYLNEVSQEFFSYNLKEKMTREDLKKVFGFPRQTVYDWQTEIILGKANRPSFRVKYEFYRKNGYKYGAKLRGLELHQVFVLWVIFTLLKTTRSYKEVIPRLAACLAVYSKEEFDRQKELRFVDFSKYN